MGGGAGWEPTTAAEVALYDALIAGDQEKYFRALGRSEVLLPVSAEALAGLAPMGWATWTSNDHTHLLAFTSVDSMRTCLAEHAGGARRLPFAELARAWPNQDWWLAINPGLPIEGYLPPWFVSQLGRGDARLPSQTSSAPRDRLARVEALERAKAARAAGQHLPRDIREPVRVSATVAPRALPASPTPPPPPPSRLDRPWMESAPADARTTWLSPASAASDQPAAWLPPSAPPSRREADQPAAWLPPPAPPPGRDSDARTTWLPPSASPPRLDNDQRTVHFPSTEAGERAGHLPQRATQAEVGDRSTYLPPRAAPVPQASPPQRDPLPEPVPVSQHVPAPDQETELLRRDRPGEETTTLVTPWSEPAAATSAWAEPRSGQTWEDPKPATNGDDPVRARHAEPDPDFIPANPVEERLFEAAEAGNTDAFLSTLLLATVMIPKASGTTNGKWRPQPIDGEPHIVCYTSIQHLPDPLEMVSIRFIKLIKEWPDPSWSFAVNPGTPVGATLPGGQLLALANWAAEVGLGDEADEPANDAKGSKDLDDRPAAATRPVPASRTSPELTVLQKAIAPSQVSYYLERGYDRVSGFVHRAHEVGHLRGPEQVRRGLGLSWEGSSFTIDADEIYLLRWSAYRPNLYRIPYGGQTESAMKAMQGWVIERNPFRGNGFAPGESKEIIAEFKVDSARLPHGARLLRMAADGQETMIAVLDSDGQRWLRTDGGGP